MDLNFDLSLNDKQKEAVFNNDKPMLILAGAGSGKTRTLTYKIAWLIKTSAAKPHEILAVTFTNKAAKEMKDRITAMLPDCYFPFVNTFHAFCARYLRIESETETGSNFIIYDEADKRSLIKEILKQTALNDESFSPVKISAIISKFKNRLQGPESIAAKTFESKALASIFTLYNEKMKINKALDFDDLLVKAYKAFRDDKPYADKLRKQLKYILIDEYQDINFVQYMLMKEICRNNNHITVVGDDDQSIYKFRGADISIILRFEEDFPDAQIVRLEQNYRSTSTILDAANALMSHNKNRKGKILWTKSEKGEKISLSIHKDGRSEARFVICKIKELIEKEKLTYKDFVIIYRTNAQSRLFEEVCMQEGVPYRLIGSHDFYKRTEIKDIIAYLNLSTNQKDNISFKRIINTPPRGIGEAALKKIEDKALQDGISYFEACSLLVDSQEFSGKRLAAFKHFINIIENASKKAETETAYDVVNYIIEASAFREYLLTPSKTAEGVSREENLNEFINVIKEFQDSSDNASLYEFLNHIALISDLDSWDDEDGKISLMTFHLTKGLEFPAVFLTGLEEKLLPHSMSLGDPEGIEEERRLFYVGITRAEKLLFMTYATKRLDKGIAESMVPSRFLKELPQSCIERKSEALHKLSPFYGFHKQRRDVLAGFSPSGESESPDTFKKGDVVTHAIFGRGQIISCTEHAAKVDFLKKGIKTVVCSFLKKE